MARHCDSTTTHHLAGSSVHVDLTFLRRRMPALAALLPYRVVVRGCPGLPAPPPPFTGEYTALLPGVSSLVLNESQLLFVSALPKGACQRSSSIASDASVCGTAS